MILKSFLLISSIALVSCSTQAQVDLGTPFSDGMVFQRGREVPVWGRTAPGCKVKVAFAGREVSAVAAKTGDWKVMLPAMEASKTPRTMTVSDGETVTVKDVLVGEVWMCSGQSNADCPIWGPTPHYRDGWGAVTLMSTDKPFVRIVRTPRVASVDLKKDYRAVWQKMTPKLLERSRRGESLPSAMGYYFALELANALDIPIGLVDSSRGGTNIDAWTPRSGYEGIPGLEEERNWRSVGPEKWTDALKRGPISEWIQQPSVLWNGMVAAYVPMACRGFIWYQGCHNANEPERYCDKMHALYNGWSRKFENPDMRLYFVQLAPWGGHSRMAEIQMAQAKFAAEEKNAGMAVVNDVGNLSDIHPNDKRTVAKRLALHALKRDYGYAHVRNNSPTLKSWKIVDGKFVLTFDDAEGWYFYNPDWGVGMGFEICGDDGKWVPAKVLHADTRVNGKGNVYWPGTIRGKSLEVAADGVKNPRGIRYLHSRPWSGCIYNDVGLPLGAFEVSVLSDVEVFREGMHAKGVPTCHFITYPDWTVEVDNRDSCVREVDGISAKPGEKTSVRPPVPTAPSIREEPLPMRASEVMKDGFPCALDIDFSAVTQAEALVEVPGALLLCFRSVDRANTNGLRQFDMAQQNYGNFRGGVGMDMVIEAQVPGPAGRIGIPLGILKDSSGVKRVRLNHTTVHWQIYIEDALDENLPFTGIVWPNNGAVARVCSSRVRSMRFSSPAEPDIGRTRFGSAKSRPVTGAIQYYTPSDHNAWVGDVVTGFHEGRFHIFYLFDRRHHRSKAGRGGHYFAHLSSLDLRNWEEHPAAAALDERWESHGTGTPFAWDGKYHLAYGLHTVRTVPWEKTTGPAMSAYRAKNGHEGSFKMADLAPLVPQGGTYAVSEDGGLSFRKSNILFTSAQNPTVYNRWDGKLGLADYTKLNWSDRFGGWKVWDDKIPTHGDCPSVFEWNGRHYIIQGFFTMAHSPDGRPGSFIDLVERGEDIYDGLAVPMASPFTGNRRILAGWITHLHGWGGWLCFRELVQDPDGRLGTKWLKETPPPVTPVSWKDLSPAEAFVVRFSSGTGDGRQLEFRVDPQEGRAQFADVGTDGVAPRQRTLQEIVLSLPRERHTVGEVYRLGPPNLANCFAIGKIRGLDRPFDVRLATWYDGKSDATIFDVEIAGRRTMVCRRPGKWKREKEGK